MCVVCGFVYFIRPTRTVKQQQLDAAFIHALSYGDADEALQLLRAGASPNAHLISPYEQHEKPSLWEGLRALFRPPKGKTTALMIACGWDRRNVTRQLLEQGADVNARSEDRTTPLHSACKEPDVTVVQWLLDRHADPNARDIQGILPLFIAVMRGHTDEARLLLEHGADPKARDDKGQSASYYAWMDNIPSESPEMVKLLKQYSVPP